MRSWSPCLRDYNHNQCNFVNKTFLYFSRWEPNLFLWFYFDQWHFIKLSLKNNSFYSIWQSTFSGQSTQLGQVRNGTSHIKFSLQIVNKNFKPWSTNKTIKMLQSNEGDTEVKCSNTMPVLSKYVQGTVGTLRKEQVNLLGIQKLLLRRDDLPTEF